MKRNNDGLFGFSLIGFFLFFITIAFTSTSSIFVYYIVNKATNGSTLLIVLAVLTTILAGAVICTLFDIYRRRKMIENPVRMILLATRKIAQGDFSVKLTPLHDYSKYTEYDLIFENINIMTAELAKNEMLKKDFISNVSHEIKTPLSVIQNYGKLLQNKDLSDSKKRECLNEIVNQTRKLSNLISNILKLNKLENQKIVPEVEEFDLSELLRETALQFENLLEQKNLQLECAIDEMKIVSSSTLLEIALNNLISNAIKFTDSGTILISLKNEKNYAIIKIKDTGIGISKEVGEHIFDKFYQGDTSHSTEGNGLGLSLVKKVIDVLGGEISVESKLGAGTTFTLKIRNNG